MGLSLGHRQFDLSFILDSFSHGNTEDTGACGATDPARQMSDLNLISGAIVHASYRIYKELGPGLMESVYKRVLGRDLIRNGLTVESEKLISFEFEGMKFKNGFKADLVVQGSVIVEVKCVVDLNPAHYRQLLTYLRLMDLRLGLLLNFSAPTFKGVVKRIAN